MATRVKNHPDHTSHSVCHHGLVKLLIMTKLKKLDRSWQHFLFWSGFEPETPETQNHSKVQVDDEETEKKTKGKNLRGKKGRLNKEIINKRMSQMQMINMFQNPCKKRHKRNCSSNYKMKRSLLQILPGTQKTKVV